MKRNTRTPAIVLIILASAAVTLLGLAQSTTEEDRPRGEARVAFVSAFGRADYAGGYLKYTYSITREGAQGRASTTTTEITPQADGTYSIASSSTEIVPLAMVHIGFFGIPLPMLGVRAMDTREPAEPSTSLRCRTSLGAAIESGKNYILPDGGRFQAGGTGTIAGVSVVYGTYTHADYTNVEIQLAFATDLTVPRADAVPGVDGVPLQLGDRPAARDVQLGQVDGVRLSAVGHWTT